MKQASAANDNEAGEQIARTRRVWQQRSERALDDESARQIIRNVTGFFKVLEEWSKLEKRAANDNDEGDRDEARDER